MICRPHVVLGLFGIVLFCGGCGTVRNLNPPASTSEGEISPPTRIYGGVRQDWTVVRSMEFSDVSCINFFFLPLYLADFPFSFIGDTLTLPYTAGVEVHRSFSDYYYPKSPPKREQDSQNNNSFAPLVGNKFDSWTLPHRVEMPVAPNP